MPSKGALQEWNALLKQYGTKIIPDEVVKKTKIYTENVRWAEEVKKQGYSILDTKGAPRVLFITWRKKPYYHVQRNKSTFIISSIIDAFDFLNIAGYKFQSKINISEVFQESLDVVFTNLNIDREITVGYAKGEVYNDLQYSFSVSAVRIPYKTERDFFSFDIYLKTNAIISGKSNFSFFDKEEIRLSLRRLAEDFRRNCGPIIDRSSWLEGYAPKWVNRFPI